MRDKYKKIEGLLWDYKNMKAEIKNVELEIEALKEDYEGCVAISYKEKSSPTNKFNSVVENEVLNREKKINVLQKKKRINEILIQKIDNALETLSDTEKRIVELRYFYKLQFKQIAERLCMNETYCIQFKSKILHKLEGLVFM